LVLVYNLKYLSINTSLFIAIESSQMNGLGSFKTL
jgi:hypothetical protein